MTETLDGIDVACDLHERAQAAAAQLHPAEAAKLCRQSLGLLVAALAHYLTGNGKHAYVLPAAILIAIICLVGGQVVLERIFAFNTALSIIIEFLGGIVFIGLILKRGAR